MRTTIEIKNHLRAKLLELAARRGLKGFSTIVEEALEQYLAQHGQQDDRVKAAIAVLGTITEEEAEAMENSVRELRETWR